MYVFLNWDNMVSVHANFSRCARIYSEVFILRNSVPNEVTITELTTTKYII